MESEQSATAAAAEGEQTVEPRRSGRIAGRQTAQPAAVEVKSKAPRGVKKKAVEETVAADNEEATKKAKSDEIGNEEVESSDAAPAISPIDVGDSLPSLVLKDEKGEDIQIGDLTDEYGVVLFLVPKADTPGCTTQACGFRDSYPDFTSVNYRVYCLSADSSSAQTKWQTKKTLPYPLISDPKRVLISALGAGEGGKTKRSHFIFEKGGKLVEKVIPVKPADSPKLALEFIKKIQA